MKEELNYNIHNILKFRIVRDRKRDFMRDLNLGFSFFEVEDIDKPDIVLNIGKFTPSNDDCYLIDHKYHIKENYLYCKDSGGKAKWEVEIFGFEDGATTINYNGRVLGSESLFPDRVPQNIILQPLIEYKLGKKGYLLIHSAGISNKNKGYVLAGRPSAFKSTLMMDFVRRAGFSWLGDDRVIIHKDKVLSFPMTPITIDYKCKYLPTEEFRGFLDKIRFVKYIHHNTKCESCNESIAESSILEALLFIARTNKGAIKKRDICLEEAVDKLVENNRAEMMLEHFYTYMLAYSFVFPDSKIAAYWDDLREKLEEILKKISIYEIEIPEKYDLDVFNEIHKFVEVER
jgi:hypothetical protein